MVNPKSKLDADKRNQLIATMRKDEQTRLTGYRELALNLFPHVCGRCGRDFEGKKLRELTVHHIDHDHDNNPPSGTNWELLCLYCHDHEHTRGIQEDRLADTGGNTTEQTESLSHSPFAALAKKISSAPK